MVSQSIEIIQTSPEKDPVFILTCVVIAAVFFIALGFASKGI